MNILKVLMAVCLCFAAAVPMFAQGARNFFGRRRSSRWARASPKRRAPSDERVAVQRTSPATRFTRHRIGERLGVRARSLLGGLHHEYLLAPASA